MPSPMLCNSLCWMELRRKSGGEGGIRTPDTLSGMPVFKTGAINRSATSPGASDEAILRGIAEHYTVRLYKP